MCVEYWIKLSIKDVTLIDNIRNFTQVIGISCGYLWYFQTLDIDWQWCHPLIFPCVKKSCLYIYLHEHHIKITLMKCKLPKEIVLRLICRWYHVLFKLFLCSLGPAASSNIFRHSHVIWYFFQRQTLITVLHINVISPL